MKTEAKRTTKKTRKTVGVVREREREREKD